MSVSSERMLSELVGQSVSASAPSLSQVRAWSSTAVNSLGIFLNNKISYSNLFYRNCSIASILLHEILFGRYKISVLYIIYFKGGRPLENPEDLATNTDRFKYDKYKCNRTELLKHITQFLKKLLRNEISF